MNAGDSTLGSATSAQGAARSAPGPRLGAPEPAQEQAPQQVGTSTGGTESFAQLIALLRTSALPGADTATKERGTPARLAKAKARGGGASPDADPVLAAAAIDPTKLAEQELRSAPHKGAEAREQPGVKPARTQGAQNESGPARKGEIKEGTADRHTPPAKTDQGARAPQAGLQQAQQHDSQVAAPTPQASGASVKEVRSAGAGAVGAAQGSSGGQGRGSGGPQHAPGAAVGTAAARGASSRAFINKLAHAAAPAREQVQQKQVADAAARGLGMAIKKGGGEVTMRLRPEGLGQLRVDLRIQGSTVEASLRAQTDSARDLLEDSLPHLKAALEAQGLTVERIAVEPGGAPALAQDARHFSTGTEAPATTPDGSGQPSRDDQEARSALGSASPGGDWAGSGTDAEESLAPLWAIAPASMTNVDGAWEWVA